MLFRFPYYVPPHTRGVVNFCPFPGPSQGTMGDGFQCCALTLSQAKQTAGIWAGQGREVKASHGGDSFQREAGSPLGGLRMVNSGSFGLLRLASFPLPHGCPHRRT
jgi:hypothetical protein